MTRTVVVIFAVLLIFSMRQASADETERRFVPAPVPVDVRPPGFDQDYFGVGHNTLKVSYEWVDNFWTASGDLEKIGRINYRADNIALSYTKSQSHVSTTEYSLLLGRVDGELDTDSYRSTIRNKDIDISADVKDGYVLGMRLAASRTLSRTDFFDLDYAMILYTAYVSLRHSYSAVSADNRDVRRYDETE